MATSTLAPNPKQYFWNTVTGQPLSGGYVYTFVAGTTTPQPTYQDAAGLTVNQNPIVLNSAGFCTIYLILGASYKFTVTDGSAPYPPVATSIVGVIQWTQDNIQSLPTTAPASDITGVAGPALAANVCCYLSDGSGGNTAGQWFLADSWKPFSSTTPLIGFTTTAIAAGATGVFRLSGQLGGFAGLVPGARYYVAPGGNITNVSPSFSRFVGQADSSTDLIIAADPPAAVNPGIDLGVCNGRLTLQSGQAVTISDVVGASTVYFTPYKGNRIALYDAIAGWIMFTFTEIPLALSALAVGNPYDVCAWNNNGLVSLILLQWSNPTTRSVNLVLQDGILVQQSFPHRRYLGTIYTTAANTTEDSNAKRFVWNFYNRVPRLMSRGDPASNWAYGAAVIRQANGNVANRLDLVIGISDSVVEAQVNTSVATAAPGYGAQVLIGLDSVTAGSASATSGYMQAPSANGPVQMQASFKGYIPPGYHYLAWLEQGGAGTQTWYGTGFGINGGIYGWVDG